MFSWFRRKSSETVGPDFSAIDSHQKAVEAFNRGELEKLFLMPLNYGGQDHRQNTIYVPIGLSAVKAGIDDNIIAPLVAEGKVTSYAATPEYQGRSFVPVAINIVASNPGKFSTTISIWGEAIRRAQDAVGK